MVALETARLRLRPAREEDAAPLHAIFSDPAAIRYWSTPPHGDLDCTSDWLTAMIGIPPGEGEDFIAEYRGRVIGKAGFYRFPEIGFILHPDYWGRGFASEALHPVLDRAFAVHGLDRVIADVDPRNAASLRLLAGLGFREVGRRERSWQIGDTWCDSVDLLLDRAGWDRVCRDTPEGPRASRP